MDVQAILAEVDRDGDGHIDYDEFVAMMMKVPAAVSSLKPTHLSSASSGVTKPGHVIKALRPVA